MGCVFSPALVNFLSKREATRASKKEAPLFLLEINRAFSKIVVHLLLGEDLLASTHCLPRRPMQRVAFLEYFVIVLPSPAGVQSVSRIHRHVRVMATGCMNHLAN